MMNYYYTPEPYQPQQFVPKPEFKYVENVSDISANDVPMNGMPSVFIKKDLSEMYVKSWTNNGTIATNIYKKVEEQKPEDLISKATESIYDELLDKIEDIECRMASRLDKLEKRLRKDSDE